MGTLKCLLSMVLVSVGLLLQGCGDIDEPKDLFDGYEYAGWVMYDSEGEEVSIPAERLTSFEKEAEKEGLAGRDILKLSDSKVEAVDFLVGIGRDDDASVLKDVEYTLVDKKDGKHLQVRGQHERRGKIVAVYKVIDNDTLGVKIASSPAGSVYFLVAR